MISAKIIFLSVALLCNPVVPVLAQLKGKSSRTGISQETKHGTVVTEQLVSTLLRDTRTGLDPNRSIKIYLPPGYAQSNKSYPVVYFCHSIFQRPEQVFADGNLVRLLERGFAKGVVQEFIFVVGDYTSPTTGSLYENTPATGRWNWCPSSTAGFARFVSPIAAR
jgi:hypothetical protein